MDKITLEKVDKVKERAFVSYKEAKEALEQTNGDVLEAIIFIEQMNEEAVLNEQVKIEEVKAQKAESVEEFKSWIMNLIDKGTVSRIRIKNESDVLLDIPVNAGIAGAVIAVALPPILIGVVASITLAKLTVEVTNVDGTVEEVNKFVKEKAFDIKEKGKNVAGIATTLIKVRKGATKSKYLSNEKTSVMDKVKSIKSKAIHVDDSASFSYTVNFEDIK